jgi:hypothetical protein
MDFQVNAKGKTAGRDRRAESRKMMFFFRVAIFD